MVVIFDEVHLLANVYRRGSFFACMEQLRRIWDAKHFGLVLSYTDLGYQRAEQERKRELMQVFRRGVLKVNLGTAPTVADVRAIVESHGLPWADRNEVIQVDRNVADSPIAALKQLANEHGITAIIERIRMAYDRAADTQRTEPSWHDFLVAHFAILGQAEIPESGWGK
jgi:DNA transposition AAA+ family ATPase